MNDLIALVGRRLNVEMTRRKHLNRSRATCTQVKSKNLCWFLCFVSIPHGKHPDPTELLPYTNAMKTLEANKPTDDSVTSQTERSNNRTEPSAAHKCTQ